MTRLLWWLPEYPPDPGGIGTFAGHVAPAVAAAGHDVTMLIAYGAADDRQLAERLRLRREPFREALEAQDPLATMRLQRRTREIKTDTGAELYHVHLCEPSPFLHVATLGTAPAPTILTLHNEELKGFDPDTVDEDRMGVRGSIINRMARHGGTAEIRSSPGNGAEVRLEITL